MSKILHSEQQLLHDWAVLVVQLFNGKMCYQVGTSTITSGSKTYRDVDVRTMLQQKQFKALQKLVDVDRLGVVISLWGQKATGLPIDFQIQDVEYANKHHKGFRSAIGIGGVSKGDGYE